MAIHIHRQRCFVSVFFEHDGDFIRDEAGYPVDAETLDYVEEMLLKTRVLLKDEAAVNAIVGEINIEHEAREAHYAAAQNQGKPGKPCHVYLMFDRTSGLYKIGKAADPVARHKQIRTANPSVTLLCAFKADAIEEINMHMQFAERRAFGEWFRLSPGDVGEFHNYFSSLGSDCIHYNSNN